MSGDKLEILLRVSLAILAAFGVGALLILSSGNNPFSAYQALFAESFFDYWGLSSTLVKTSPMLLAGLAVVLPYKAGLFNIGGEGQIYLGGLFGTVVALAMPDLPGWFGIPLILTASMIGGALWAAIPGLLRAYRGINEVIVTLLMNFIAINLVSYAVSGPMQAVGAPYPYSEQISEQFHLPILMPQTDAHMGVLLGVIAAVLLTFWLRFTPGGFQLQLVGLNATAARYAGVRTQRSMVFAMIIGGALAGLAGGIEVLGLKYRLFHLFSDGYGYDGIVVAFIAALNPLLAPISAFFLAGLSAGAGTMQRAVGVEGSVVEAIQGIVVLFVAASLMATNSGRGWRERLTNWKIATDREERQ